MIDLKSLKASGFRAFTREVAFEFENPVTLVFGANHLGKSSTLNAIEWCLFGNDCVGTDTGIRERLDFKIPNKNMKPTSTYVDLVLEDIDTKEAYKLSRKWISAQRDELTVTSPDGKTVSGDDAEKKLAQITRSEFRDFLTSVYQHQEAIRAVLTQKPSERNDAIDRLLGLSDYRNVLTGIEGAKLQNIQRDMGRDFDDFTHRIGDVLGIRERDLEDKRNDALKKGISKGHLNERGALEIGKEVKSKLEKFSKETGIELKDFSLPSSSYDLQDFNENARNVITGFRSKMPDVKEQNRLYERQTRATNVMTSYRQNKEAYDKASKDLETFIKKNGEEKAIRKTLNDSRTKLNGKKKELSEADAKAAAVRDSIKFLKVEGVDKDLCPVCGQKTDNLLDHLEQEWKKNYEKNVGKIHAKKNGQSESI